MINRLGDINMMSGISNHAPPTLYFACDVIRDYCCHLLVILANYLCFSTKIINIFKWKQNTIEKLLDMTTFSKKGDRLAYIAV